MRRGSFNTTFSFGELRARRCGWVGVGEMCVGKKSVGRMGRDDERWSWMVQSCLVLWCGAYPRHCRQRRNGGAGP